MSARLTLLVVVAGCFTSACTHTMEVRSEPPGAAVYVDGEHVGQTPVLVERPTSHEDVMTLSVQKDGREARVAVLENGWALEPIVAGIFAMGGATLLGVAAAGIGYVGFIATAVVGASLGPGALVLLVGTVGLLYGGLLVSALAIYLPFFAAGELGRKGPDEVLVDFRRGVVSTVPAGHAEPLIGVSPGHAPLAPSPRQREKATRPLPKEEPRSLDPGPPPPPPPPE